jgi:hypothetical protein
MRTSSCRGLAYNPSGRLSIGARGSSITSGLRLILVNFSSLADLPLFAPLAPILGCLSGDRPPPVDAINVLADSLAVTPLSGGSRPIRFATVDPEGGYEAKIFHRGQVPTRADNWHDFFNALVWLTFPRAKAALNACHMDALEARGGDCRRERGAVRDTATHFDECGVIVVSSDRVLVDLLRQHEWRSLFWGKRDLVCESMRFYVFGHATYDLLRAPFVGLCAKAVFVDVETSFLGLPLADQLAQLDVLLAERWLCGKWYCRPRDLAPIPLLGIPGVTPDSECAEYYKDERQFRPRRRA